ncbi:divalent metal cation (Fe/Co/Zn/Cd) transporter [Prauserella isguenensis]|uniref:Divalent metal cation (Fe/Co/Zn/Cd) transporter n=1 Tax=Prauserella isguenensis TaxID=1470180 RepID=A0A839RXM4_9PSEU|nr:divalent metal cation (Fe/Co/Zn/Cd) transporter [Prauserella isguenensis]
MSDDCCAPGGAQVAASTDSAGRTDSAGPAGADGSPGLTTRQADVATCDDGCCSTGTGSPRGPAASAPPDDARRAVLSRRVRLFVAATITYNVIEAVIAITAGAIASSAALIGFGLDSTVEVASAAAVAWQFAGRDPQRRERLALKVIAVSFFALAAYVTFESVTALLGGEEADHSTVGITLAAVSLAIMPVLSYAQRRAGRELGSASAVADSKQTLLCTYLSAVVLVGLLLNSLFGWAWADPAAALVIAALAVKEGRDAWRGDHCC